MCASNVDGVVWQPQILIVELFGAHYGGFCESVSFTFSFTQQNFARPGSCAVKIQGFG